MDKLIPPEEERENEEIKEVNFEDLENKIIEKEEEIEPKLKFGKLWFKIIKIYQKYPKRILNGFTLFFILLSVLFYSLILEGCLGNKTSSIYAYSHYLFKRIVIEFSFSFLFLVIALSLIILRLSSFFHLIYLIILFGLILLIDHGNVLD